MKSIIVQKYGGSSIATPDHIKRVAKRIISSKKKGHHMVVVVSAMGKTTNALIALSKQVTHTPPLREYDALLATGEKVSAALMAMAIESFGYKSCSLTGAQAGILTETVHSKAKILDVNPKRILKELKQDKIVIVTGFQGITQEEDITTIGRGGSDTSAVVLAAALKAECCEIYTDVDGVFTTDPRVVKEAKKVPQISYDEMLEMASLGAKVLHPRAVETAKINNIVLHVRSSFNNKQGTLVKEAYKMEKFKPVTGIAFNSDEVIMTIKGIRDKPGYAAKIFSALADGAISIDMIIQSAHPTEKKNNITFTVSTSDFKKALAITQKTAKEIKASSVTYNKDVAKVSIIGVGMISSPGVAAKMFSALGKNKVNIDLITTSEIKISCVVGKEHLSKAISVLHKTFDLDKKK